MLCLRPENQTFFFQTLYRFSSPSPFALSLFGRMRCPSPQNSRAPQAHKVQILAPRAGYLFPASRHLTRSLGSAAQQICCAALNQGIAKEVHSLQKPRQVGSAGDALLTPSTLSGDVILLGCWSAVFVCSEVAGFWGGGAVLPVPFSLPESETICSFSLMRKILWSLITNEVTY